MGCDIHAHVEVRIKGEWHHYSDVDIDRNYALFEKMAGVRGDDSNAISLPRGLPADLSAVTRISYESWRGDAHSMSWLNSKEMGAIEEWTCERRKRWEADNPGQYDSSRPIFGYIFGDRADEWPDVGGFSKSDLRVVFWFDN